MYFLIKQICCIKASADSWHPACAKFFCRVFCCFILLCMPFSMVCALSIITPANKYHADLSSKITKIKKSSSEAEITPDISLLDRVLNKQNIFKNSSINMLRGKHLHRALLASPTVKKHRVGRGDNTMSQRLIPIQFQDVAPLQKLLTTHSGLLSSSGKIIADKQTNQMLIMDHPKNIIRITNFIHAIDIPQQQVMIKARIIDIDDDSMRDLGVDFAMQQSGTPSQNSGYTMSIPQNSSSIGTLQFPLVKFLSGNSFDMKITALEHSGHVKLIATPQLLTINRHDALIQSGEDVPYQQATSNGGTSVSFKKANLSLKVTPIILPKQRIRLQLLVNHDEVGNALTSGVPMIRTRQLQTQVVMHQGQTLVLGGIFSNTDSDRISKIPFLSRIPLLGWIFKHHIKSHQRQQLLVFVTPTIMRGK